MQFKLAVEKFLDRYIGVSAPQTVVWYRRRLALLSAFDDKSVATISEDDLRAVWITLVNRKQRWVNHPSGRSASEGGLSAPTLASYIRCWRSFFKWCVEASLVPLNPASKLKMPQIPNQPPKAVQVGDMQILLAAAQPDARDYAILCFLIDTGCRVGGLVSLTLSSLDLKRGRAIVLEKGQSGAKRTRTVYMKKRTIQALKDYLVVRPSADSEQIFIGARGPLTVTGVYGVLKRLAAETGIKGRWNPHAFRHGFARAAVENGADLSQVSQLLGHSSVGVTAQFYARWADHELQQKHTRVSWLPDYESPDDLPLAS